MMLRVSIIGCGKIADQHAAQIRRIPGVEMVGTCDREPLMSEQLAERFGVSAAYSDVDRLLQDARPDVVHITTPPQSHFALGRQCIEAGCHVYIEKPFTVTAEETERLLALAVQKGVKVTAGHNAQFGPEMLDMRAAVRAGYLGGPPVHVESTFSYDLGDARYVKALLGDKSHWIRQLPGKLLHNIVSHGLAKVAEFLPSERPSVAAVGFASPALTSAGEADVFDELRVLISDPLGATAYFTFTTQVGPPVQELRIFGPQGSLFVDSLHRTMVRFDKSTSKRKSYLNFFVPPWKQGGQFRRSARANISRFVRSDFHMDAGLWNLITGFYRAVEGKQDVPIPYREILLTSRLMDDIFVQLSNRLSPPP
jgi:predicted dehydrogenase